MSRTTFIPQFIYEQHSQKKFEGAFDGTVVCVDIAGFDPLIQNSIDHGHNAANAIRVLNKVIFAPIVVEVETRGGFVANLDGTRIVAIFPHDPKLRKNNLFMAQQQALQTAVFICNLFAPKTRAKSIENFSLTGRVSIASGQVDWGIPGLADKYTFYFYGTAVKQCLATIAQAKENSLVSDTTFWESIAPIHDQITAVVPEPHREQPVVEITACTLDHPSMTEVLSEVPQKAAQLFVPDAIIENVSPTESELHESCTVHILLNTTAGDENFDLYLTQVVRAVAQFSGILNQVSFTNDGCLLSLSFGLLNEESAEIKQAAECLRSIENSLIVLDEEEKGWHIGMSSGRLWAGILGAEHQNRYTIGGTVIERVKQLALKSEQNEIWADNAIHDALDATYRIDPLGTMYIDEEQKNSIPVFRLAGKRMLTQLTTAREIVGRQDELARLHEITEPLFAQAVQAHFAGVTYVDGNAGLGKSHFIAAFQRQLMEQHHIKWFYCPADAVMAQSLHPFKYALRQYFHQSSEHNEKENKVQFDKIFDDLLQRIPEGSEELKEELQRSRSVLGASVGLTWEGSLYQQLSPELRFENLLSAIKNFIIAESLCQPVVVQMEDSHWLDSDSQQLVSKLTRGMSPYPVAIISNARYDEDGKPYRFTMDDDVPQAVLDLSHFTEQGTQELAEQVLEGKITAEIAEFIFNRTKGNPFHIEQMALDLNERGLLKVRENGHRSYYTNRRLQTQPMPRNIDKLLISRLERMPTTAKQTLQSAAVLGQVFEIQVLSHMVQTEWQLPTELEAMAHKQIWSSLGELQYLFKHALLWEAAYNMQAASALKERHRLAMDAIQAVYAEDLTQHYASLAYHSQKAGMKKESSQFYQLAGDWAASQYANDEAVEHYTQALAQTSSRDAAQQYALLLLREKIYAQLGNRKLQKDDIERLQQLATQDEDALVVAKREAEVAIRQTQYYQGISEFDTALGYAETAVSLADGHQWPLLKVQAMLAMSNIYGLTGKPEESRQMAEGALALIEQIEDAPIDERLNVLNSLGSAFRMQGDYDQAAHYYQQSYELSQTSDNKLIQLQGFNGIGHIAWLRGEYELGIANYEKALKLAQEVGDRVSESTTYNQLGLLYTDSDRPDLVQENYEKGLAILEELGNVQAVGVLGYNLATYLFAYQGEYVYAIENFKKTYAGSKKLNHPEGVGYSASQLSQVYRYLGQYETAESYINESIAVFESIEDPRGYGGAYKEKSSYYNILGKNGEAVQWAQKAIQTLDNIGEYRGRINARAALFNALIDTKQWDAAERIVDEIRALYESANMEKTRIDLALDYAKLYQSKGDEAKAAQYVTNYIPLLKKGATPSLEAYLVGYHILKTSDATQAEALLQTAHQLIQERADKIEDEALRNSYLEINPINQEIRTIYAKL